MHDIHYMRKFQRTNRAVKCSCGDTYLVKLPDNFTQLKDGEPEVYFFCAAEDYETPVGVEVLSLARRVRY